MRSTRKLFLASALTLASMFVVVSSASAVTIRQEVNGVNSACPAGPSVAVHVVTGGCHAQFQDLDGIPFLAHTGAAEVVISGCRWAFEVRLATNGAGFITEQVLTDTALPGSCTRRPCDEAGGAMRKLAWPVTLSSTRALEFTFCLRTAASGEGGAGTNCSLHLPIVTIATHRYQIGSGGVAEYPCEGVPQVEFTDVELVSTGEQIEIS